MITTPNELPDCAIWLDAADISTMYQEISVTTNSRQNIAYPSDTFYSSNWRSSSSLTYASSAFATLTPYGTTWSTWVYETNTGINGTQHSFTINVDIPISNSSYTVSVFVKTSETRDQVYIGFDTAYIYANLVSIGSIGPSSGTTASGFVRYTDGWYRFWFTKTVALSGQKDFTLYTAQSNSSYTINNSSTAKPGVFIGGLMVERTASVPAGPGTFIRSIHGFGLEESVYTFPYIQPDRNTPVTRGNQSVAYWVNKSLSATTYGLSGFHTNCFNSYTKPRLNSVWSGTLSALEFTTAAGVGRRYLTAFAQTGSLPVSAQTIFVVARNTNSGISQFNNGAAAHSDDNLIPFTGLASNGPTQTLFTQTLTGYNSDNASNNLRPLVYDNTGGSYIINNNISSFVAASSYSITADTFTSMYANWLFGLQLKPLQNTQPTTREFIATHTRNGGVINNYFLGVPSQGKYSRSYSTADAYGNYTASSYTNNVSGIPLSVNQTANLFRIGSGISTYMDMSRLWGGVIAEVIVYLRCLTQEEIQDVEYYLSRKWFPTGPRTVYALSSVSLDNTLAFSISGEPSPWNTLLSSDIVFTNGYSLTANTDIKLRGITNQITSQFLSGGSVTLLNGVTYTGDVIGGTRPYAVTLEPGSTCTIKGNIYGSGYLYSGNLNSGYLTNSFNGVGVYVPSTSTLNHTGTINGGMDDGANGVTCVGTLSTTGPIYGSGISRDVPYQVLGSANCHGVLIKDTNFTLPKTYNGMTGAGVGLIRSKCTINNQVVHCIVDYVNASNGIRTSSDVYGRTAVICALSSQNSSLTALNTQFYGTTTNSINHNSANVIFSRTCVLDLSSNMYIENCNLYGDVQRNHDGVNTRGDKGAIFVANYSTLTAVNCNIYGSTDYYFGSTVTNPEARLGRPGLNVRATATATLINCRLNPSPGNFNTAIINTGTVYLTGSVRGGVRLPGNVTYHGVHNCGTLYATGIIQPNYSGAEGINNQADGTAIIRGIIRPAGPLRPTIVSQGPLTAFYSAPLESSLQGCVPIAAQRCVFISLCSTSLYSSFSVNGLNELVVYRDKDYVLDQPSPSDVLQGAVYAPFNALTGTAIIPPISETIIGVPVQNSYGIRKPLTVDALWNQPITVTPQLSTNVFSKLITPITSSALSAIGLSLVYPPPPTI